VGNPRLPIQPFSGPRLQELAQLMDALGLKERYARWTRRPALHPVGA
jgi:hypothetical protein